MTTINGSINISKTTAGNNICDLKCSYNFNYPETNIVATNNGQVILFKFDNSTTPPVVYNEKKYTTTFLTLVSPSIHYFNGAKTNAELVIIHTPVLGGNQLYVCLPISQSNDSNDASSLVTQLIQNVANNAPAQNESTNINISNFTLNSIVPKQPYYSYTDGTSTDFIVFDIYDAISVNSSTLTSLQKIIKPFPLPTPGTKLFYNKNGPNNSTVGDGIYISCKPTGSSKDKVSVEYQKNPTSYNIFTGNNEEPIKIMLQFFFALLIFCVIMFIFSKITGEHLFTKFITFIKGLFNYGSNP
jgi:carbonic anhydrase